MTNAFPVSRPLKLWATLIAVAGLATVQIGLSVQTARAGASLTPLSTWSSNGDGWLSPGEDGNAYLGTGNNERGIAYGNGHVYLVSRTNIGSGGTNIRILDSSTGADLGALDSTGITGGFFTVDMIAVAEDGAVYVSDLSLTTTTSPYKVYKWATEGSVPTVVYEGDSGLNGARIGDTLAAIGSGSSTRLVAGYGSTPSIAGNNGYSIIDPTAGTATAISFPATPPNAGDFRTGITFTDASHVLGAQGSSLYRYTSYSGSNGTLIASPAIPDPAGATADRLLAYTTIAGVPLLAVQSVGDAHVSVYYVADLAAPVYLASGRTITGATTSNSNGTGEIAWGATTTNLDGSVTRILYGMSTNSGIQAFNFTLQGPPLVSGDYNYDGVVDGGDYVVWSKTLNQPAIPAGTGADGSANGTIGPEDFTFWRARFGNPNPGSGASLSSAVPEPGAFVLAVLAMIGGISGRRPRVKMS